MKTKNDQSRHDQPQPAGEALTHAPTGMAVRSVMQVTDRIAAYRAAIDLPASLALGDDGRLFGVWVMGNNYRVASGYYGGYPHGFLQRLKALFPDKRRVLHLFSGRVDLAALPGDTVDINSANGATYVDDAQTLTLVPVEDYDLIVADPPYSVEDCDHYQTSMIKRNVVMRALGQRLRPDAHVAWLDQVLPMYRKDQFSAEGYIGVVKSTNHRFRVLSIFRATGTKVAA